MTQKLPARLAGRRVLVAEDESITMMLLEDMLEELEAKVVGVVNSTRDIVRVAREVRPDIVTLDINLNGEPAYEAAASLQEQGIPLVFVSGYDVLPECPAKLQNTPRVKKPFSSGELASALEEALQRSQGPA